AVGTGRGIRGSPLPRSARPAPRIRFPGEGVAHMPPPNSRFPPVPTVPYALVVRAVPEPQPGPAGPRSATGPAPRVPLRRAAPPPPVRHNPGGPVARVIVDVMLKPEILDPQGQAIMGACGRLGFSGVTQVRQGKRFEIEIEGEADEERLAEVRKLAETLLANPVIEDFSLRVEYRPIGVRYPLSSTCPVSSGGPRASL